MKIQGISTTVTKIDVKPIQIIKEMFNYYFKHSYNDLQKRQDGIYFCYDVSMHGSPEYQYELITKDPKLVNIYDGLIIILNSLMYQEE